jgi:hypothetical protein
VRDENFHGKLFHLYSVASTILRDPFIFSVKTCKKELGISNLHETVKSIHMSFRLPPCVIDVFRS